VTKFVCVSKNGEAFENTHAFFRDNTIYVTIHVVVGGRRGSGGGGRVPGMAVAPHPEARARENNTAAHRGD
jgi:hypothetical protein